MQNKGGEQMLLPAFMKETLNDNYHKVWLFSRYAEKSLCFGRCVLDICIQLIRHYTGPSMYVGTMYTYK